MKESDFLQWIYSQPGFSEEKVPVGPGDDMAIMNFNRDKLLIACDQVIDGVHFELEKVGPRAAGRKAIARNLSDVAAMGALPTGAVASVILPENFTQQDAQELYHGIRELGDKFHCPLVGGDTASWGKTKGKLAISLTIFATPAGATGKVTPILRSGARANQPICVTGKLGGAWTSDKHLNFSPRVQEGILLAFRYKIKSMIDISDGLARDLLRICEASGTGAEIYADKIPISEFAGRQGVTPLESALTDGEDYELLFTLPRGQMKLLKEDPHIPVEVTQIGNMTKEPGLFLIFPDGTRKEITNLGWDHET